jgi:hypothetical protein
MHNDIMLLTPMPTGMLSIVAISFGLMLLASTGKLSIALFAVYSFLSILNKRCSSV